MRLKKSTSLLVYILPVRITELNLSGTYGSQRGKRTDEHLLEHFGEILLQEGNTRIAHDQDKLRLIRRYAYPLRQTLT